MIKIEILQKKKDYNSMLENVSKNAADNYVHDIYNDPNLFEC